MPPMDSRDVFRNLSPLDHRYWQTNAELFERLADHLSESASVTSELRVEAALLEELVLHLQPGGSTSGDATAAVAGPGTAGGDGAAASAATNAAEPAIPSAWTEAIRALPERVTAAEVYAEEETTRHHVRALVNVIQRHLPEDIRHLVHLGATSVDVLDTASALRYRGVVREVLLPLLADLQEELIRLADTHAETVSIGRTHGQHAVPITVGFALAEYVSRLGQSLGEIELRAGALVGKLAGAVGAYNATSVLHADPEALERAVLGRLGLEPGEHATQIVSPEPMLRLLLELNTAFGVIANLADDLRHLQRSELAEMAEYFGEGQVGSSTMPHKRNPWNAEHVKSLWKAFAPRSMSWFMDQISEHQRDLTNSASQRFVAEFVAGLVAAAERMRTILTRLHVDTEGIARNLDAGVERVWAEPLYILLAAAGRSDAHERLRQLTLSADEEGVGILEMARREPELWATVTGTYARLTGGDAEAFFADPARYTGRAAERARSICATHRQALAALRARRS